MKDHRHSWQPILKDAVASFTKQEGEPPATLNVGTVQVCECGIMQMISDIGYYTVEVEYV